MKHYIPLLILPLIALGCTTTEVSTAEHTPYNDTPHAIPGLIEMEHYDDGPAGIAYYDVDEKNLGEPYRENTQVDIEKRDDASNGHGIGWTRTGEWLLYTVKVKKSGPYTLTIPVASNKEGGYFHLQIDGRPITDPILIPDTGGWQTLNTITAETHYIEKGIHTLKLSLDTQGPSGSIGDIDYIQFDYDDCECPDRRPNKFPE